MGLELFEEAVLVEPLLAASALTLASLCGLFLGLGARSLRFKGVVAGHEHRALHDDLTGLPNRAILTDRGQQAIAAARRDGAMLAVMVMDLNRFKEVNDSLGHHHGDLLLRELGNRLRGSLRDIDTVARFGGDEFAMLLARVSSVNSAVVVADKVRDLVRLPLVLKDLTLSMDSSIGIAMFPEHGHDWASLMQHADVAMYVAKAAGSGREVYAGDGVEHSSSREALVRDMKNVIQTEELVLHYQPQVEIASGHVATVEALVRWQHPGRGLLWPNEFLAIAETTNWKELPLAA